MLKLTDLMDAIFSTLGTARLNTVLTQSTLILHSYGGKVNTVITNFIMRFLLRFIVEWFSIL